jgi:hypothetical protein
MVSAAGSAGNCPDLGGSLDSSPLHEPALRAAAGADERLHHLPEEQRLELDGGEYVIVPDSAILLTIRDSIPVVRAPGQNARASRVSSTTQPSAPAGVSHG